MNKKGWIVLLLIFLFMFILNILTPMFNEDYFSAFVWPQGIPNLGTLPEDAKRVSSFSDVLENCRVYYLSEGGRLPGGFIVGALFWNLGKTWFNPVNALLMILLIMEIYWLSHEGAVSLDFNSSYIIWIFFSLWAFNASFTDACLWMSGSSNYLWMMVLVFAFLLPYVANYFNKNKYNKNDSKMTVGMFVSGILAGWSHETTICWLIVVLFCWLYVCKKENNLQTWKITGFIGLCLGYILLIFAPGNFARLAVQQQSNSVLSVVDIYQYKLVETAHVILFHVFLWYFIVNFFLRYKNRIKQKEIAAHYLSLVKMLSIIAFGSGIFMFLIPASTWRVSFLNLAFLTLAVSLLFRLQEITNTPVFNKQTKVFLKFFGFAFLFITATVSLWCNYVNWNHWNEILVMIRQEQQDPTNAVLQVEPYYTSNKPLLKLASGFHILPMPLAGGNESHRLNVVVAKYYGIKGIRIIQDNNEE